jgi:hypothetical protein
VYGQRRAGNQAPSGSFNNLPRRREPKAGGRADARLAREAAHAGAFAGWVGEAAAMSFLAARIGATDEWIARVREVDAACFKRDQNQTRPRMFCV